jgi:hypothetical protein
MFDSLSVLLVVLATVAIIGLAAGLILTAFRRKRSPCPECGTKTIVARAAYKDEATGQLLPGEADIPYALVAGSAKVIIGIIAIAYIFVQLVSALGYENCGLQGVSMVCKDILSARPVLNVNLVYGLIAAVGGAVAIVNGGAQFLRAIRSREKAMVYEYLCTKGHHWEEK